MERFTIPARFAADHFDRCGLEQDEGGQARVVRAGKRTWVVEVNAAALANLGSDANYYADAYGPDEQPAGLRASAKRTVAAISRTGGAA